MIWTKAVVVEGKDWSNDARPAFPVVANVLVLGRLAVLSKAGSTHFRRDDAVVVGDRNALLIFHFSSQAGFIVGESVQLVISGHPKDCLEQLSRQLEGCAKMLRLLTDITACGQSVSDPAWLCRRTYDQAIVLVRVEQLERLPVEFVTEMKITDGQESAHNALGLARGQGTSGKCKSGCDKGHTGRWWSLGALSDEFRGCWRKAKADDLITMRAGPRFGETRSAQRMEDVSERRDDRIDASKGG